MGNLDTANALITAVTQARTWLLPLEEDLIRFKPAADRWSIAQVMGHLVDSACNNHQRFVRAQETGPLEFPKYDQNAWVDRNLYQESDWRSLVELWYLYNLHLAQLIEHVDTSQLETRCTITPLEPCTLEFLIVDYLDHLNHHLQKIQERIS